MENCTENHIIQINTNKAKITAHCNQIVIRLLSRLCVKRDWFDALCPVYNDKVTGGQRCEICERNIQFVCFKCDYDSDTNANKSNSKLNKQSLNVQQKRKDAVTVFKDNYIIFQTCQTFPP